MPADGATSAPIPAPIPAPIIVSAFFAAEDQAWLDGLRRAHFPPERNHLAAHLTLFHHLPPSIANELRGRLAELTCDATPVAETRGLIDLGGGTAIRIASPALEAIRADLAEAFADLLIPQDRAGFRPHVTIQNKVARVASGALQQALGDMPPRRVVIAGLASWWYRGGPWELLSRHAFRLS